MKVFDETLTYESLILPVQVWTSAASVFLTSLSVKLKLKTVRLRNWLTQVQAENLMYLQRVEKRPQKAVQQWKENEHLKMVNKIKSPKLRASTTERMAIWQRQTKHTLRGKDNKD